MQRFILLAGLLLAAAMPVLAESEDAEPLAPGTGVIVFAGSTIELKVYPGCHVGSNGAYNFWLVKGLPSETAGKDLPRLQAVSSGEWSRLVFYPGDGAAPLDLFGEGDDFIPVVDGELHYEGPIGKEGEQQIEVHVRC